MPDWDPQFQFRTGFPTRGMDAQKVGERLSELATGGDDDVRHIPPEVVVEDARDPSSPMHAGFTWDDAEAATAHRLEQARSITRSVMVRIEVPDREPQVIRAFLNIQDGKVQRYVPLPDVVSDEKKLEQYRSQIRAELNRAHGKCAQFDELGPVMEQIELALKMMDEVRVAV